MWGGVDEFEQCSKGREDCFDLLWASPLSYVYQFSLSCVVLLSDLHSTARPLLLCSKEHLLFLIVFFLECQHPPSKPCQISRGPALLSLFSELLPCPKHVLANIFVLLFFKSGSLTLLNASITSASDN